ncbi:MAG: nuclear transport factor 2 family protein [Gammaproteobacteria bacterium]|jgi:gamma-hexachlorocyclohexane dehydrochlorinase|nr:nuclear transport factor 2 family protein [Gammaproteobacteria bacterium]
MNDHNDLQTQIAALTSRIDELESRAALRDLVTDYCLGFDNHDWDRFISIWHPDAIWEIGAPFGTFNNHEGIREAVFDILYPVWRETHHLTSNLRLTFHDADHASGVCNVDCMGATADDIVQMISATYSDDFERRGGVWKIARRHVVIHYFNPVPGAQMSAPEG